MFKSILFPTDLSERSAEALGPAVEEARRGGSTLHVLHVYGFAVHLPTVEEFFTQDTRSRVDREVRERVETFVREHVPADLPLHIEVREGTPYEEIVAAARSGKHDLIVMASHRREGIGRLMLGGTAERVVRHSQCSVLLVRPGPTG